MGKQGSASKQAGCGPLILIALVIGLIIRACSGSDTAAGPTTPTPTVPISASQPGELIYTVISIENVGAIKVVTSANFPQTIYVSGISVPGERGCFRQESEDWAAKTLTAGTVIRAVTPAPGPNSYPNYYDISLADGLNYAELAVRGGYAKPLSNGSSAAIVAAEAAAKAASAGLWAAPCNGEINLPPTLETPKDLVPSVGSGDSRGTTKAPKTTVKPQSTYYKNCDEARAAGAAPLYAGQPGYRPGLDADKDGKACDRG